MKFKIGEAVRVEGENFLRRVIALVPPDKYKVQRYKSKDTREVAEDQLGSGTSGPMKVHF